MSAVAAQDIPGRDRPWIAYVAPFAFPEGGAAARRVLGNAQSLVRAGYDVVVVSAQIDRDGDAARPFAPGLWIASTSERDAEHLPRALKRLRYAAMGRRTRNWIAGADIPPAAVILYSGYTPYLMQLMPMCRRRNLPLLFDAVEWYTAPTLPGFLRSPYLWNTEFAMRALISRLDGVIAISSYLARWYSARRRPVAQIPPTLDLAQVPARTERAPGGRIVLAYSGSASNDLLDVVIAALMQVDPQGAAFELRIAGPQAADIAALPALKGQGDLPPVIRALGRVPHAQSLDAVRGADFTVFLRRINRVSTAGFPTKFCESLSLGTPVITNLTSDLASVLKDWENGFVCPAPDADALAVLLRRVMTLSPDQMETMRVQSRTSAEAHFDMRLYADAMAGLITAARAHRGLPPVGTTPRTS